MKHYGNTRILDYQLYTRPKKISRGAISISYSVSILYSLARQGISYYISDHNTFRQAPWSAQNNLIKAFFIAFVF